MKLWFIDRSIGTQLEAISTILGFELHTAGITVDSKLIRPSRSISISYDENENKATIEYGTPVQLFRAISLLIQKLREGEKDFHYTETQHIKTIGVMLDASRNAVLSVAAVKKLLSHLALMGINMVMLYTEDTYEVKGRPYFGYMRGRYSQDELKQLDDYAYQFGIELIPCIQTLGHMKMGLQWADSNNLRDDDDVLLIDEQETYTMIRQMVAAASAPFRTKRIHIGMDEAYQVGRGAHLDRFGYEERFTLMKRHLNKVIEIVNEYELSPMIWSDMFFGSSFLQEHTEDAFVTQEMIDSLPKQVQYVYWDYFSEDPEVYHYSIQKHKMLGTLPVFAGGIWTWTGMTPNYGKTFATTSAAMKACRLEGIEEVFATLWGDNGQETNLLAGLLGMQLYAEYGYSETLELDKEWLAKRFAVCSNSSMEAFYSLSLLDEVPGVAEGNLKASNPSKFLLYQDLLLPLFDANIAGLPLRNHYELQAASLHQYAAEEQQFPLLFMFYATLAVALAIKSEISLKIKATYDEGNKESMKQLVDQELAELENRLITVQDQHRQLWFAYNKPFGWEVIDIRYGGVIARLRSAKLRLNDWINGRINQVEELEQERLYYLYPNEKEEGSIGRGHYYHRIVTASNFSG